MRLDKNNIAAGHKTKRMSWKALKSSIENKVTLCGFIIVSKPFDIIQSYLIHC